MDFKAFLNESKKFMQDVHETLDKLPKKHKNLIKDFKFEFQPGHTLKNDTNHIGVIDEKNKKITIAAPYNYGREYAILHEIGHIVWKYLVSHDSRKAWADIVKNTKTKQEQNNEELFCQAYSNFYAKNKIVINTHDKWEAFIKNLP